MKTIDTCRTSIMADEYGTDLNLLQFNIKEECSPTYIKVEEVDEDTIKTETEVAGGSWVYQNVDINELLANKNRNVENSEEQLLNENAGIKEEAFENFEDSNIWETVNTLRNYQKHNENGLEFDNERMDFDREEKVSQDLIENVKINNKEGKEKSKFLHKDNDYQSAGTLKKRVLVSQKKCEKDKTLNHKEGKQQKSEPYHYNATDNKYKCNACAYVAVNKSHLLSHIKSHHTMEKCYKCNECSYAAVKKRNLLSHIRSRHTMDKPHKCNECSYATVRERDLLLHIKARHTMDKPYKCNECSYATVREHDLLLHIKSRHTMDKPYKCSECSYATVRVRDLLLHIKSRHTMEKPYKCNECSYSTVREHDLLSHIKFCHTTEKPYKCNECSYAAVSKCSLLSHIKYCHTIEKRYKCSECSYAAVRKRDFLVHIESHLTVEIQYSL